MMRLRWWKTKEEIRALEWEARQNAIQECKADLAWALAVDKNTSWTTQVDLVKMLRESRG